MFIHTHEVMETMVTYLTHKTSMGNSDSLSNLTLALYKSKYCADIISKW